MTLTQIVYTSCKVLLEFDPAKDRQNQRKHGISLARFADMDEATWLSAQDTRREYGEERWVFFGLIDGVLHSAVITFRGDTYRIMSLRHASRRERRLYGEAFNE